MTRPDPKDPSVASQSESVLIDPIASLANDDGFAPVRAPRLSEEIVNQIANLVATGKISLNQRFPSERALQEKWRVSRPVLREAFRVLEAQGIVESRPGGGRFLRSTRVLDAGRPNWSDLRANRDVLMRLWEAREAVESKLAELAAIRATEEDIEKISRPIQLIEELAPEDLEDLDLNGQFHAAIATAARNPILEQIGTDLIRKSGQVGFKHLVGVTNWAALQSFHQPILDAIRARDPAAAVVASKLHFDNLRERVREAD
ncbi:FCD domain-containing protein [Rhodobacterales bacterium HKCCSP123]|nr:FCD domain-containing protein [Rhodobacterales bacterium HKCCSP123]